MGFVVVPMIGLQAICLIDHSLLHIIVSNLIIIMLNAAYHKAQYWAHYYFYYISMTEHLPLNGFPQFYLQMIQIYF